MQAYWLTTPTGPTGRPMRSCWKRPHGSSSAAPTMRTHRLLGNDFESQHHRAVQRCQVMVLLGLRVAKDLRYPPPKKRNSTTIKANVTTVKAEAVSNGNYITSAGKQCDAAWSTRADWCKLYGKMGKDSISITIIDSPVQYRLLLFSGIPAVMACLPPTPR